MDIQQNNVAVLHFNLVNQDGSTIFIRKTKLATFNLINPSAVSVPITDIGFDATLNQCWVRVPKASNAATGQYYGVLNIVDDDWGTYTTSKIKVYSVVSDADEDTKSVVFTATCIATQITNPSGGNSPYYNATTGTWWQYSDTLKAFEDTGVGNLIKYITKNVQHLKDGTGNGSIVTCLDDEISANNTATGLCSTDLGKNNENRGESCVALGENNYIAEGVSNATAIAGAQPSAVDVFAVGDKTAGHRNVFEINKFGDIYFRPDSSQERIAILQDILDSVIKNVVYDSSKYSLTVTFYSAADNANKTKTYDLSGLKAVLKDDAVKEISVNQSTAVMTVDTINGSSQQIQLPTDYLPLAGGTLTGDLTVTGPINSTYISTNHIGGVSNSAINCKGNSGYVGWINGPTKGGRASIATCPDQDNVMYFNYGTAAAIAANTNVVSGIQFNLSASSILSSRATYNSFADVTLSSYGSEPLTIGYTAKNLGFDGNEIQARANGAASDLFLNRIGGAVRFGTGQYYITSDGSNYSGNASSATKATQDGSGNVITSTYLPISGGTLTGDLRFSSPGTATGGLYGTVGSADFWRLIGGASAPESGWLELATADDGNEPIYVRQYSHNTESSFGNPVHSATLLDASGNTSFPGTVTASAFAGNATSAYSSNYIKSNTWNWSGEGPQGTGSTVRKIASIHNMRYLEIDGGNLVGDASNVPFKGIVKISMTYMNGIIISNSSTVPTNFGYVIRSTMNDESVDIDLYLQERSGENYYKILVSKLVGTAISFESPSAAAIAAPTGYVAIS